MIFASSRSRTCRHMGLAALGAAALVLGGCYSEGGPGYSSDSYTYVSTPWQPKTITLKDTRTGQDFWSVDVPVGKKLAVQFSKRDAGKDVYTPDLLEWAIIDESEDFPSLGNRLFVPDRHSRRLDVTIRPTPELPEGMNPRRSAPASKSAAAGRE